MAVYARSLRFSLVLVVALAGVLSAGGNSLAATFTVTKNADTADGTCDADCSLREAVEAANSAAGPDTITLSSGTYSLSIAGSGDDANNSGDLDIADDVTIQGAGAANTTVAVSTPDERAFDIISGSALINGATIQNGKGEVGSACECGGGIYVRVGSSLAITDSVVTGNTVSGGAFGTGGGIQNDGTLTLTNTAVSNNSADFAGGINNGGTAILTINGGSVELNTSTSGVGGIELPPGSDATLTRVEVNTNTATGSGGGFDVSGSLTLFESNVGGNRASSGAGLDVSGGTVSIVSSAVHSNFASGDGGGIFSNGDVTLTNSTISSNGAGGLGSGILNNVVANLNSLNSTIAGNNAPSGLHNFGTAQLKNTIVAANNGADCVVPAAITSLGHNLDSDGTCALAGSGDLPNRDARLGPLEFTIGPTFWHPLLADSPAIDAGDNTGCTSIDQRGIPRPQDGDGNGTAVCDIGSYEAQFVAAATGTPVSTGAGGGPTQPVSLPGTGGAPDGSPPLVALLAMLTVVTGGGAVLLGRRLRG